MTCTAAPERNGSPSSPRGFAELYLKLGLAPVPLPSRSKDPGFSGWPNFRLTAEELDRHFPPGQEQNVAVLNGAPSDNRHDVDLDCAEALRAAPLLLPATGWIFGRPSAPASHRIYRTDEALDAAQEKYKDLDGETLAELRGNRGITVFPPSLHKETGERIQWVRFLQPAELPLADLQRAVRELAAGCLLARHWPAKGSRQDAYLALSGGLLRAGWDVARVERFVEAVATAGQDEETRKRVETVRATADKMAEDKKTTGWPQLMKLLDRGEAVCVQARDWLGLNREPARQAEPELAVPRDAPWPAPLAEEAFHGLAGKAVRLIEPATEADPAAVLIQVLVGFGSQVGRGAHFRAEADRHHANEFAVIVDKTAKARKGTSWGRVRRLLVRTDEPWERERVQSGLSSGEGLIWHVRDPIEKQEKVKRQGEVRYETVLADPGVEDKRLLVLEPEFANVLRQTERSGNNLSTVIRQAWDGIDLKSLTKNSPARSTGAHVSIVGHITADELRRYLSDTETANGFGNRFLWCCAQRSKLLPEGGIVDEDALDAVAADMARALDVARTAGEVRRDDAARALWRELYPHLSADRPGMAGALLARAEAHVMRLALLYALLDSSSLIRPAHLLAACALWEYVEQSVGHIFGNALGDPVADEILRLLRANPDGASRTDLMGYFGRNQSSDRIGRALGLLLQYRLAESRKVETGGRPQERWYLAKPGGP